MKKIFVLLILLFLSFSSFAKTYYGKEDNGTTYRVDFAIGEISDDAFKQFCLTDYKYFIEGYLSKEDTEDIFGFDLKNLIEKYSYIIYYNFDEKGNTTSATLLKLGDKAEDAYIMIQGRNTILEAE